MIIDDEPAIAQGLKVLIDWGQEGCEIAHIAYDAKQALSWLRENTADLVLLDVQMPGMNGLEMMKTVQKENLSKAAFIVLSGYNDFSFAQQALRLGCLDYLLKPIDADSLRATVRCISSRSEKERLQEDEKRKLEETHLEFLLRAALEGRADKEILRQLECQQIWNGFLWYSAVELSIEPEEEGGELENLLYLFCKESLPLEEGFCLKLFSQETGSYEIGLVLSGQSLERNALSQMAFLEQFQKRIEGKLHYEVRILAGKKVSGLEALSKSYSSCAILRSMTSFRSGRSVWIYEEELQVRGSSISVHKELIDQILEAVRNGEQEKIVSLVDKLYSEFDHAGLNSDSFKLNIHYLLFQLMHLASSYDNEVDQSLITGRISDNAFVGEVRGGRHHLEAFLLEYADYLIQLKKHVSTGVLQNVEREIRENYAQNLTLRELGAKYALNSSYLGQIFRRKYGLSFKDYLNQVRIQASTELLVTTDKKVAVIAEEIGYRDTNYFVRKFIELKGCTPTKFRRDYLGK